MNLYKIFAGVILAGCLLIFFSHPFYLRIFFRVFIPGQHDLDWLACIVWGKCEDHAVYMIGPEFCEELWPVCERPQASVGFFVFMYLFYMNGRIMLWMMTTYLAYTFSKWCGGKIQEYKKVGNLDAKKKKRQ